MGVDRVNLVREGFEAWNSEDPQWVLEHMTADVEWIAPERDPFPGTYTGYEGVQEFWAAGGTPSAGSGSPQGGDRRGGARRRLAHRWARNEVTGLQISDKVAQVFSFNDEDNCIRVQEFHDRGTALKAAGLEGPSS